MTGHGLILYFVSPCIRPLASLTTKMADTLLLKALKSQPKVVNLNNSHLDRVPSIIGNLTDVLQIRLKNNSIAELPPEFGKLTQLEILNLGNNIFEELPDALKYLSSLLKLHLFNNRVKILAPSILYHMRNLTFLNLNNNKIRRLPPEICKLASLQHLSMDNNLLMDLPFEMCALTNLQELHAAGNHLAGLPLEMGFLINIEKLYLQKNKIKELPESLGKCYKLRVLDIAANELRIFPTEIGALPLKELYCEQNPLLQYVPVHSVQEEEVLALKELVARFIMRELKDRWSYLRRAIRHYPSVKEMLAQSSKCSVCGESFLNTWLECVTFIDAHKLLKTSNACGTIPVRALLCSYKCFNAPGHEYYGVAFP